MVHYSHNSVLQVCCTLDCLSQHTVFTIGVIYKLTLVWYSTKQSTMHRPTSHLVHLYVCSALVLAARKTKTIVQLDGWFHWPVFVMATLESENIFLFYFVVSNQNFTDGLLLKFDFFPSHCNRHLQWSALFTLLCMTRHSCSNLMPLGYVRLLQWQKNRPKATMWLLYNIPAIQGCPRRF
jgi:hypothetical protein